jgi:hypothetical protein
MTDRLSKLEMSGNYHLKEQVFQIIQWKWKYFPKVDLFTSKLNKLVKTYASVIPRKDPDNIGNALRLDWSRIKGPVLLPPPIIKKRPSTPHRGISTINAYLHEVAEHTLKSYKSGWKKFIYFLVEENYNNSDWEDKNFHQEIYLEFLNCAFVGK